MAQESSHLNFLNNQKVSPDIDDLSYLDILKVKNPHKIIIGDLNVNSISHKFDQLKGLLLGKVDILVVTETKVDASFPDSQFRMEGFCKPFHNDRNRKGGGLIIFVREDIPWKKLDINLPNGIELLAIEINLRKVKWLLVGCHHPHKQNNELFFEQLSLTLDRFIPSYGKFLITGDFNCEDTNNAFSEFLNTYQAQKFVKDKTCFKLY